MLNGIKKFIPLPGKEAFSGIAFVFVFALLASVIAATPILANLHISPIIVGMILGMVYAQYLRPKAPESWSSGIHYTARNILRLAIIFYGFRLTFQNIADVGLSGVIISILMVALTFILGYLFGVKVLKMDKETTILTASGASICGAAAVMATESVIRAPAHKSMVALGTVVLFGTLSMFLYPALYNAGMIPMPPEDMGIFIGGAVHEVAHVVAAGDAVSPEASNNAVIVKMIRVMLLAPFLILLGLWLARTTQKLVTGSTEKEKQKIYVPWFAVLFIVVTGFNSLHLLPQSTVNSIIIADGFALTMAVSALGMETSIQKIKAVGMKPLYLAFALFVWLLLGGYTVTAGVLALFGH